MVDDPWAPYLTSTIDVKPYGTQFLSGFQIPSDGTFAAVDPTGQYGSYMATGGSAQPADGVSGGESLFPSNVCFEGKGMQSVMSTGTLFQDPTIEVVSTAQVGDLFVRVCT